MNKKISSPDSTSKLTESELKERINRLCKTLANKVYFLYVSIFLFPQTLPSNLRENGGAFFIQDFTQY